jgi:hypothetical protein
MVSGACGTKHLGRSERRLRGKVHGRERATRAKLCERSFYVGFNAYDGNGDSKRPKPSITVSIMLMCATSKF